MNTDALHAQVKDNLVSCGAQRNGCFGIILPALDLSGGLAVPAAVKLANPENICRLGLMSGQEERLVREKAELESTRAARSEELAQIGVSITAINLQIDHAQRLLAQKEKELAEINARLSSCSSSIMQQQVALALLTTQQLELAVRKDEVVKALSEVAPLEEQLAYCPDAVA